MEEINLNVESKGEYQQNRSKKGWIAGIVAVVAVIVIFVAIFAGGGTSSGSSEPVEDYQITNVEMTKEYSEYLESWDVKITGELKNTSGKDFSYIQIEISVYDANGIKIDTAYANESGLAKGETWRFNATTFNTEDEPHSYKVSDVSYW